MFQFILFLYLTTYVVTVSEELPVPVWGLAVADADLMMIRSGTRETYFCQSDALRQLFCSFEP